MTYVMLLNLRVVFLFVHPIIECFKKIFMRRFAMGSIVVYCTIIISNILNKVINCIKLRVVKGWLT